MIVFVDTSAFYAVLDRDDQNHQAAAAAWKTLLEGGAILVTHSYVLVETCALIQNRLGLDALRIFEQNIVPLLTIEWITKVQHESG